jgi:hypothetical protein
MTKTAVSARSVRHFSETSFFGHITGKILNDLLAGVQKWRSAVTFSE